MGQSKATKKFERRHLKDTLERRNGRKKIKQKLQLQAQKKARRLDDVRPPMDIKEASKGKLDTVDFNQMSVDEFFQGGFEIPEVPRKKEGRSKRKREDVDSASDMSLEEQPVVMDEEEAFGSSEDDEQDHKAQLDALAERDPEFHRYLLENEPELLDARLDDIRLSEDEKEDVEGDLDGNQPRQKRQKQLATDINDSDGGNDQDSDAEIEGGGKNELDAATVRKWYKALTTEHSLRAAKEVVLAFRAAAHNDEDSDSMPAFKYSISNPEVYHRLLTLALRHIPAVVQHHLPLAAKTGKAPTDAKKFRTLAPLLRSHVTALIHLLSRLSDAGTQRLTLAAALPLLPYILSFKKLIKGLTRASATVWAASSATDAVRIAAFLILRRLVVLGDPAIRETVLKMTYQALVHGCRHTTTHSLPGINLLKNSAAELWGLAPGVAYTTAFTAIRQLAIHLRTSITQPRSSSGAGGPDMVHNWQYAHSLDFWSRVLSLHARESSSPLRPLIYPYVHVTLGALRIRGPDPALFPFRFHLARSLLHLGAATGTYIPLAAALCEVLHSPILRKPAQPSTLKPLDFTTCVRAPAAYRHTRVYQEGLAEQVQELLAEFLGGWAGSVAFPELALPVIVALRRWLKEANGGSNRGGANKKGGNRNTKINSMMTLLVQKVEAQAELITTHRARVDFAPNDKKGVEGFLREMEADKMPLGAFVKGLRLRREERAKLAVEEDRERGRGRMNVDGDEEE
ncbi:hypothetical protein M433DRAFT_355695 [Acidomyces richmondensis BFW]|nr:MAG: hypothetical protein FE78DRAFT_492822 [Acidomyces sp. 'richmondensis']KYG43469.1 hypothetical protein M433DRAFT_355695 [Acidomyces richmondensis BFW]